MQTSPMGKIIPSKHHQQMWRNIQALYTNTKGRVLHLLIKETDTYNINIGLLEGSKLSPILYAFLVNSLLERLQQLFPHLSLSTVAPLQPYDTWTGAVLYADNLTLVAHSPKDLQEMLNITQAWAEEHFVIINTEKSVTMSFFEAPEIQQNRLHEYPTFQVQHTHKAGTPTTSLKEVTSFTYLGLTLDPQLTFDPALRATIKNFWYAHTSIQKFDVHKYGLHPKHQLTLWKHMVLSTTDTCLPFLHTPQQASILDDQINLSLASIFVPKRWDTDCLHKALRAELGIPSATTYIDMAAIRLHSLLATQPDGMPARTLYQITAQPEKWPKCFLED
jgi:hypothetical protein